MKFIKLEHIKKIFLFTLILTIIFAYNDKSETFILSNWIINFLLLYIFCFISSFIHETAHLFAAYLQGCALKLKFIEIRRYWITTKAYLKRPIKLGAIFPLIITLFSNGLLYFPVISTYEVTEEKYLRLGKRYPRVSEWELAKIAASGPLASILLAVLFKLIPLPQTSISPVLINILIAVLNILPLPLFDGYRTFFYSKLLFIFSFIFIVILSIFLQALSPITALILALVLAIVIFIIYLVYPYIKK